MENLYGGRKSGNSSPNFYVKQSLRRVTANEEDMPSSSMYDRKKENESYQPKIQQGRGLPFRISQDQRHRPDGHPRTGSYDRSGSRQPRSLGYSFLETMLNNDAEKILLMFVKERNGFTDLLEKDINPNVLVLVVKILKKVSSSAFSDIKYSILHSSFSDNFVTQLQRFIACLPQSTQRSHPRFWREPNDFFGDLLEICDSLLQTTPTFACKTFPVLLNSFKIYIPVIEDQHNVQIRDDIKDKAASMQNFIKLLVKENEDKQKSLEESTTAESLQPPDDFRKISVYPTPAEIVSGRGFLRPNVTEGPYQSVNHYLDVQFRLLREDFVGPLRNGIENYRTGAPLTDNIKIHKKVQFLSSETINEFYCLRVQFDSKKKGLNFENSKRFMYGSLLCFTEDNFQTLFFGKVAQRKIEDLKNGQVIVAFDDRRTVNYNSTYLMIECSVYFEPYFHVLTVLKSMTEENFPMERYIIRVNPSVQPPEYLTVPDCKYEIEGHEFNPLVEWPNENFYSLNESQMVAFKAAICQEIAVIQGPPGTGKTYMGLKIAETLLRNKDCWYDSTPMLVICYTNHALDQFLEGLLPVTTRLIRVGGQSKSTKLEAYNLRSKSEREITVSIKRREVQDCLRNIKVMTENMQQIDFFNSVISFHNFVDVVPDFEDTWFATAKSDDIIKWLVEGGTYGRRRRQNNLEAMQVCDEFNRIGMNDEVDSDLQTENSVDDLGFNDHIISKFDSIFEEVFEYLPNLNKSFFLLTLSSMRDQLKKYEDRLLQLGQVQSPTLQELIMEEQLRLHIDELEHTYEYVKAQLSQGRHLRDHVRQPHNIDLSKPYSIGFDNRWQLYFYWLRLYRQHEEDTWTTTCAQFPTLYKEYEELRQIEDVRTMRDALVIGMTTTSAARLRSSLQTLKSPIVIVEEAAEVLEAHIVTSVTKDCKHLILIGDHKQLRPSTASYKMEKQYRLGISLFERMIINKLHCYTLNVQHRMRPEISCLIRPSIYDFLEDHPSVLQRPVITGVDNCLYFIDHDNTEEPCEGSSKMNLHEVKFLIYLARHLVLNGYNPEHITILAAYLGQFFEFKKMMKAHLDLLDGVRIAVLDNYQGEESDIILLSLVRNNEDNKIGFLAIENRVCVALSRAKNAMYIMGNMAQLASENQLWRKIKTSLERQDALGKELPLRCQIHQDQVTRVKCDEDFFAVSEGGCTKKCDRDLKCGHKCTYLCHIRDREHMFYKCQTQCNKQLCKKDETHICKKMCFEDCGSCMYNVKRTLKCGHEVSIPCHIDPDTYKCQVKVPTELPCGHKTDKPCFCDPQTYRCPHICDVQVQPCGHSCELYCHIRTDPNHEKYQCKKPCTKFMKDCSVKSDDHRCRRLCYQECDSCTVTVRKRRTVCPHLYDVPCNSDVDELICEKPCQKTLQCGHTCKAKCNEPCRECQLKVFKTNAICGHQVKVKCCEPPDRKYCNRQCPLKLPCGHPCTNKCNEPCTTKCTKVVTCDGIMAECGHIVTMTECHMTSQTDPKLLLKYCKEPCNQVLKCGHKCAGSCGECVQGRVHKRCSETCGMLLVCDHKCQFPCRQACRPCKRVCEYRCLHSACKKFCGEVCTPCREPCPRRCKHQRCTKLCGDFCSVGPCNEPCEKLLRCGHPCVGFCGDFCPPKCMVCDRDDLLEIFLGNESEDAKYVYLNDCGHIIENTGLEEWLLRNEENIGYKVCPQCKTAIRTTQRYSDYIKRAIRDVAQVKLKTNGRVEQIVEVRKDIQFILRKLEEKSGKLVMYCQTLYDLLRAMKHRVQGTKKGRHPNMNIYEAQSLKAKLQLIERVINICCDKNVSIQTPREVFFPQVKFIIQILSRDIEFISSQEIEDVTLEIKRLARIVDFSCIQKFPHFVYNCRENEDVKSLIVSVEKQLFRSRRFTEDSNTLLKALLTELNDSMKSGLAISDEERVQIVAAMGFSKGHWFKCPNGHIYAIGECGGAMQEANCIECGARIGGANHQLLNDNSIATEMDGATYGAYSERANLLNYGQEYLENLQD